MKRTTKLVSVLLAVLIALSSFAILPISAFDHSSKAPGSSYEFGDVNRDGVIDIMDATLIQKKAVDKANFDNEQMILGDVNGDGEVDIIDATLVQKFVVERIDKFPVEDKVPTEPTTIEEPTEAPEGDYYILGTMNGWSVSDDYKLTANEAADGEFVFTGLKLKTTDKFKVAYSVAGAEPTMWFPNGYNDNYGQHGEITADGTYDLYFRPDGQGGEDWFKGVIYLEAKEAPTAEPDTTAAPEPGEEGYYIVGTMTGWGINPDYKLTANEAAEGEYMFTGLNLTPTDEFKVVYSEDGLVAATWYPDGDGNNYGQHGEIKTVGVYDIYFRPDGQGGEDWFYGVIYAANQEEPQPTQEPDTTAAPEPTEEGTTAAPVGTITVKFTDALGWGDVHVYYWPNGAEWPGTAMEKAEVNDYGQQVYTAEIPANVDGIIFNGNGNQTVDIKTDIADGAQWYTIDEKEGNNYKVTLVGAEPETEQPTVAPTEEATTAEPATDPEPASTFLLTDNFGWGKAYVYAWDAEGNALLGEWPGTDDVKTTKNELDETQFIVEVPAGAAGVIVNNGTGAQTEDITDFSYDGYWMDGTTNELRHYLVTGYNVDENPTDAPETTAAPEPTEEGTTAAPAETITVKFTDALGWGDVHVYYWPNGAEWPGTAMEKAEVNDFGQQVYTAEIPADVDGIIFNGNGNQTVDIKTDIADGAQWYTIDEKEGNNYKVTLVGAEPETEQPTVAPTEEATTAEPATDPEPASTFLLTDNFGWGKAYVYAWDAEGNALLGEWPGTEIKETQTNDMSETQFVVEVPAGAAGVIVNNGTGAQTEDITDFSYDGYWMDGTTNELRHYLVTGYNVGETPTDEPTQEPTEEGTTAAPAETITVKFTDALSWGDVHVYYWPNGAEWPGTAMEKAEVNDFGQQVYTAEIPADVDGIIFNGNGNQTVDIKTDIADGAQWYTIDEKEGNNYKVTLVGSEPATEQPTDATEQPTTVETFPKSFYVDFAAVLGQGTNWYAWTWDDSHDGVWRPVEKFGYVAAYDNVVFASFNTDTPNWDNVVVQTEDVKVEDGNTLYILNEKDENSKLKTSWKPVEQPTTAEPTVVTEPTEEPTETTPANTITVKFTDALSWGDVHVYYWNNGAEWPGTAMEKAEVNDFGQQVYTAEIPADVEGIIFNGNGNQTVDIKTDIADGAQWYTVDEKEGNNYKVTLVGSEPETEQPTDATEQPTTVETFPKSFYVDFTAVLGQGTNWYAWTWDDSHDGVWRPVEKFGYVASYDNVVFASFNTDVPDWNNKVVQTENVIVEDGNTLYILNEKDESGNLKTSWKGAEQPTTAEPTVVTEPTEEPTETTPVNTITVKFTDALSWGDVHVYYWNNGAEWPGTAMEKAEVNDFGQQVYTAVIPADVEGIIFNGNGNQTVDIKTDIADGAQWYTIDEKEGNNYKVTLVGSEPATEQPTEVVEPTTEAPTDPATNPTEATDPTEDQNDTITIKFTDALSWGDVHVYYWNNGAEWPGTAMEKAEVNDFGQQVYTAEIPADVDGIIFNGNGNQTVDITTGIADGAQWYTVNEKDGNNYKVTLVGEETQPTEDPTPDPEPTGTTVKLQPNSNWTQSGARFAIYVFNDSTGTNAWADMTAVGDGTYTVTIPEGTWDKVIFVRMNPSATENNWNNKWNQSANLDINEGKLYTVPSNSWDYWTA